VAKVCSLSSEDSASAPLHPLKHFERLTFKNKAEQTIKQLLPSHFLHNTTKPVNMSDSDDSMGSASEYEYHSQSEDEEDSYSTGEAKKCSPQASKGLPYFLLSASDCELRKNEVNQRRFLMWFDQN
jgi:hypothetical protein